MAANGQAITKGAREELINRARYEGPRVTVERLDPIVFAEVKKLLTTLGARYVVKRSAFDFASDVDARSVVDAALMQERVMHVAVADGFVGTPAGLAIDLMAEHGNV